MVTPEIQQYVQQQRAAGRSIDEIRAALISSNWSPTDIDQLLHNPRGIIIPKWLVICLSTILILGIVGGSVYAYLQVRNQSNLLVTDSSSHSQSVSPSVTSNAANPTSAYAIYHDNYIRFSYDPSWKVVDAKTILKVKSGSSSDDIEPPIYFFSPEKWPTAKKIIETYQAQGEFSEDVMTALDVISPELDQQLDVVFARVFVKDGDTYEFTAYNVASLSAMHMCIYPGYKFGMNLQTARVQEIIINNRKAYAVLPESACPATKGIVFFHIDGEQGEVFVFSFRADDIQQLSPEQKIIFDSIEIL